MVLVTERFELMRSQAASSQVQLAMTLIETEVNSEAGRQRFFDRVFRLFLRRSSHYQVVAGDPETLAPFKPDDQRVIDRFMVPRPSGQMSEQDVVKVIVCAPGHYEIRFNSQYERLRLVFFPMIGDRHAASLNLTYGVIKATNRRQPSPVDVARANQAFDEIAHESEVIKAQLKTVAHRQLFRTLIG